MKKYLAITALILTVTVLPFIFYLYIRGNSLDNGLKGKKSKVQNTDNQLQFYSSSSQNFKVLLPPDYIITERITYIDFKKNGGVIGISRTDASNFESLNAYLKDFDDKSKIKNPNIVDQFQVGGNDVIVRQEVRGVTPVRISYIFVDGWVYGLSTNSEDLYADLDQITKSFQYTPN